MTDRAQTELATKSATKLAPESRHCPTCRCTPADTDRLIVYPSNELLYGRCETCGIVRWDTEIYTNRSGRPHRSRHCGCCTHPHDLNPGSHMIPTRGKQ